MLGSFAFSAISIAQARPGDEEAARLFTVAKNAFDAAKYGDAARALDECYRLTKDPKYLWSLGVAAEKAYWAKRNEAELVMAVNAYRAYVKEGPEGNKRATASQALQTLEPLMPKAPAPTPDKPEAPAPPLPAARTGIMVSSPTPGARIELDHKLRANAFLVSDVEAGPHHVVVAADGFIPVERDVPVQPGALVGIDVPLSPKPALLEIRGGRGADLFIDGEPKGELPLSHPLSLQPGDRLITIQRSGAHPMVTWKSVERGTSYSMQADLPATGQRYAAYGTFAAAGIAAVVGGALTGMALHQQSVASDIRAPIDRNGSITAADLTPADDALRIRDRYAAGAGVAWGVAGAGLTAGLFLFVFDKPAVQAPPAPSEKGGAAPPPKDDKGVDLSVLPALGPGLSGMSVVGRF